MQIKGTGSLQDKKEKLEKRGIIRRKNAKKLKKICIFPPFLAKRVGFFDWKKSKITAKNMPSEARRNKKLIRKEDLLNEIRFEYEM